MVTIYRNAKDWAELRKGFGFIAQVGSEAASSVASNYSQSQDQFQAEKSEVRRKTRLGIQEAATQDLACDTWVHLVVQVSASFNHSLKARGSGWQDGLALCGDSAKKSQAGRYGDLTRR